MGQQSQALRQRPSIRGTAQRSDSELVSRILTEVPTARHRAALEAACAVRVTHRGLLAYLLEIEQAGELFGWLAGLPFVEEHHENLWPHGPVRAAVIDRAQTRDPVATQRLYARARSWYRERLVEHQDQPYGPSSTAAMLDLAFLHRANSIGRRFLGTSRDQTPRAVPALSEDLEWVRKLVERHEGPEAMRWFEFWAERQPEHLLVCRGRDHQPLGMIQFVELSRDLEDVAAVDPCTRAFFRWSSRHAPLRAGERVLLTRFWMAADRHQAAGPVATSLWIHTSTRYRLLEHLALGAVVVQQPDFWSEAFRYMGFRRADGAGFVSGDACYGVFAQDWREQPVREWHRLLELRQLDPETGPPTRAFEVALLAEQDFAREVRRALRFLHRPSQLDQSLLLRSPLVVRHTSIHASLDQRREALRELIRESAQSLLGDPTGDKLYRALAATYLEPGGTQEEVAEALDLPFTTYRRHLTRAVQELTAWLWTRETSTSR